jgi:hypothetical protein
MEINGIPLHPLVVHAAVVFGPVAALVSLIHAASAKWRVRLEIPAVLLAIVASGAIFTAWFTGRNFLSNRPELKQLALVHTHQHRANILALVTIAYVVLAIAAWVTRAQPAGRIARVLLAVSSIAVLGMVVAVGDAGARAVWS